MVTHLVRPLYLHRDQQPDLTELTDNVPLHYQMALNFLNEIAKLAFDTDTKGGTSGTTTGVPRLQGHFSSDSVGRRFLILKPRAKPVGLRFLKLRKRTKAVGPLFS